MIPTNIYNVFFSPAGSTKAVSRAFARGAGKALGLLPKEIDFTLPKAREKKYTFCESDLVFFGVPVNAGRIPNKILPFVKEGFLGNGAYAAIFVTYGNRNFDDALMELKIELEANGFRVIYAEPVICRHVFSPDIIAPGKPSFDTLLSIEMKGEQLAKSELSLLSPPLVPGNNPVGPYYVPKDIDGNPTVFLKAKPETNEGRCNLCGKCVDLCPMGSIQVDTISKTTGICIKCQACILGCPSSARKFTDEEFLKHVRMLEANFQ